MFEIEATFLVPTFVLFLALPSPIPLPPPFTGSLD